MLLGLFYNKYCVNCCWSSDEISLDVFHLRLFYAVKRGVDILIEQPISSVPRFLSTRFLKLVVLSK